MWKCWTLLSVGIWETFIHETSRRPLRFLLNAICLLLSFSYALAQETIVAIRHGEKPPTNSEGNDTVITTYDAMGRVASVTNPYRSIGDSTYGVTSYTYDALSRKLLPCQQDNDTGSGACVAGSSYLQWVYTGNVVDPYDEARHPRMGAAEEPEVLCGNLLKTQAIGIGGRNTLRSGVRQGSALRSEERARTRGLDRRLRCGWVLVMRRISSSHVRGTWVRGV